MQCLRYVLERNITKLIWIAIDCSKPTRWRQTSAERASHWAVSFRGAPNAPKFVQIDSEFRVINSKIPDKPYRTVRSDLAQQRGDAHSATKTHDDTHNLGPTHH